MAFPCLSGKGRLKEAEPLSRSPSRKLLSSTVVWPPLYICGLVSSSCSSGAGVCPAWPGSNASGSRAHVGLHVGHPGGASARVHPHQAACLRWSQSQAAAGAGASAECTSWASLGPCVGGLGADTGGRRTGVADKCQTVATKGHCIFHPLQSFRVRTYGIRACRKNRNGRCQL